MDEHNLKKEEEALHSSVTILCPCMDNPLNSKFQPNRIHWKTEIDFARISTCNANIANIVYEFLEIQVRGAGVAPYY